MLHIARRVLIICLIFFLAGGLYGAASAQTEKSEPIGIGELKSGNLSYPGQVDAYTFYAVKGDVVDVKMTAVSGNVTPQLALYCPNGNKETANYSEGSVEISFQMKSPDSGQYTIRAGDHGSGTGRYDIIMFGTITAPATPTSTPVPAGVQGFPIFYAAVPIGVLIVIGVVALAYTRTRRAGTANPAPQAPVSPRTIQRELKYDVFVSYSQADKPVADAIVASLEAKKISCWIAPRDVLPGMNYQASIIDAIDASRILVMVFSSASNHSPHTISEVTRAMNNGLTIIPFRVENVPLSKSMEYLVSVPQWLDATVPPLEKHVEELARIVRLILKNAV